MRRHIIWKTSLLAAAVAALLLAGCGGGGKDRKSDEDLPDIEIGVNLIVNPGFEEWSGAKPVGWRTRIFKGEGTKMSFYQKSDKAKTGTFSMYLRSVYDTDKWVAMMQQFPVRPGHEIVFSADIMTERVVKNRGQDDNLGVYVRFLDGNGMRLSDRNLADEWTSKRTGTNDWRRKEKKTEVPDGARMVEIGIVNQMTGYAYFDDVSLVIKPKMDWESKDSKFVTYNWFEGHRFPRDDMKRVSRVVEDVAKEVGIKRIEGTINYYLYPDDETFMKVLERKKVRTIARWKKKELHDVKTFNDHEIIHLILYDLGFPPVALSKGFVFYFRAKYNDWDMDIRSQRFLREKQVPALYKTLDPEKWVSLDHKVVVPAWASFVGYLIDNYGMDTFKRFYSSTSEIKEVEPFIEAFEGAYGMDFLETDRSWRLHVLRYKGDAAADTLPGALDIGQ